MPVEVDVPRKHRGLASQRCIKRVVCRREFMLVHVTVGVAVAVVRLGELCLVGMRVTTMLGGDRDFKAVRFRDFLDGFPVQPLPCEPQDLSSAPLTQRLNRNGVGTHSRKAEARRDARLEDRQFQYAVAGRDSLQLGPMHLILVVVVPVLLGVSEAVAMTVPMPAARSQFAPRRNRDPTAKSNERDARRCLDEVAKTRRDNNAGKPHHQPD
jgi:hypothetical protein